MKLKNKVLFDTLFMTSFKKLIKQPLQVSTSVELAKTFKVLSEQQKIVMSVRNTIAENLKIIKDGKINLENDEKKLEFNKRMNELIELEFEIPLNRKLKLPNSISISGEDLIVLEDILNID